MALFSPWSTRCVQSLVFILFVFLFFFLLRFLTFVEAITQFCNSHHNSSNDETNANSNCTQTHAGPAITQRNTVWPRPRNRGQSIDAHGRRSRCCICIKWHNINLLLSEANCSLFNTSTIEVLKQQNQPIRTSVLNVVQHVRKRKMMINRQCTGFTVFFFLLLSSTSC